MPEAEGEGGGDRAKQAEENNRHLEHRRKFVR